MKFIPLAQAVIAYNAVPTYLKQLIKSEKVTGSITPDGTIIDEESLKVYLAEHPVPPSQKKFELNLTDDQVEAIDPDLFNDKDALTMLRLLKPCKQAFNANIRRMSLLIENEKDRDVFYSISTGVSFKEMAEKYGTTVKAINNVYKRVAGQIAQKEADTYQMAKEESERCGMLNQTFRYAIKALHTLWVDEESICNVATNVPDDIMAYLNTPLSKLNLCVTQSILYILHRNNIITLADLLKLTKKSGWNSLLKLEGLGENSYTLLIKALIKEEITDRNMNCYLYRYLGE